MIIACMDRERYLRNKERKKKRKKERRKGRRKKEEGRRVTSV